MSKYTYIKRCSEDGCKEFSAVGCSTKKEYRDVSIRDQKNKWLCTRHRNPEKVLSIENLSRVTELIVIQKESGRYWSEDGEKALSGFQYGNGYKAYAKDFPVGTKLTITAIINP